MQKSYPNRELCAHIHMHACIMYVCVTCIFTQISVNERVILNVAVGDIDPKSFKPARVERRVTRSKAPEHSAGIHVVGHA